MDKSSKHISHLNDKVCRIKVEHVSTTIQKLTKQMQKNYKIDFMVLMLIHIQYLHACVPSLFKSISVLQSYIGRHACFYN